MALNFINQNYLYIQHLTRIILAKSSTNLTKAVKLPQLAFYFKIRTSQNGSNGMCKAYKIFPFNELQNIFIYS